MDKTSTPFRSCQIELILQRLEYFKENPRDPREIRSMQCPPFFQYPDFGAGHTFTTNVGAVYRWMEFLDNGTQLISMHYQHSD